MTGLTRRHLFASGLGAAAIAGLGGFPRPALAQGTKLSFKLGTDLPVPHPVNVRIKEAIAAIASETNGAVEIALFPSNQLGSDSDMLSQIRSGALELATFPGTVVSTLVPATSLTVLGFAFPNYDRVWAAMDGEVGAYIRRAIEKTNLVPFEATWDNGFRQITTSTKPIRTPADLKAFKIRVPVVPLWVSMFSALGAAPVSIPLSEAYSALQTKIADGQENPLALINFAKFYEVQKFCSLTNHAWDGFWMMASGRVWRGVPADVQAIMVKHFNAAALKERDDIAKANIDLQKDLEAKGLVFNTVDPMAFQTALKGTKFYSQWREKFGADAWALVQKYAGDIG
ncbi:TRAP transporter substrate-binding protein [Methylobacterium oryzisoli]|uniref:TRAP transporter substrate-binding protein n=1 Tax=Methylobacterium oryzisoli TaxID=3385502 RepID=UPI003891C5D2